MVDPEGSSHLDEINQRTTENLDDEQKMRVAQMLNEFQDIFSRDDWDLGLTLLAAHAIVTERGSTSQATTKASPDGLCRGRK